MKNLAVSQYNYLSTETLCVVYFNFPSYFYFEAKEKILSSPPAVSGT